MHKTIIGIKIVTALADPEIVLACQRAITNRLAQTHVMKLPVWPA